MVQSTGEGSVGGRVNGLDHSRGQCRGKGQWSSPQ